MQGQVKWFNATKGYGFITESEGKDVFVHHSQIKMDGFRCLNEDDIVSFELGESDKNNNSRVQAINVEPVLTMSMVEKALKEENLYVKPMKNAFGHSVWMVVDENNVLQSDERGMNFMDLAAYAGFSISEE